MIVPGSGLVKAQAEAEARQDLRNGRFRLARAGRSVPGDNPDKQTSQALCLDLESATMRAARLQGRASRIAGDGGAAAIPGRFDVRTWAECTIGTVSVYVGFCALYRVSDAGDGELCAPPAGVAPEHEIAAAGGAATMPQAL
jgi:hypothetical protein